MTGDRHQRTENGLAGSHARISGNPVKPAFLIDRWGQSKITTGSAVANVLGDFTLTPEFKYIVGAEFKSVDEKAALCRRTTIPVQTGIQSDTPSL